MTSCSTSPSSQLHPAPAGRFSPMRFKVDAVVSDEQVDTLLDAARLAPSAGNSQPWSFIVGRRGDAVHQRIVRHLARSSNAWAPSASALVVNLAHVHVDGTDLEYSEFSRYDLGQAVAHMSVQGLAMGRDAHQFRAFDQAAIAREFEIPPHWEVVSMTAFGLAAHRDGEVVSPGTSRARADRDEVTWARVSGQRSPDDA